MVVLAHMFAVVVVMVYIIARELGWLSRCFLR